MKIVTVYSYCLFKVSILIGVESWEVCVRGKGKWRAKGMQSAVVLSHGDRGTPSPHAHIPTLYSNPPTQTHACERRHSDPRLGDTHVRNEEQFSDLRNGRVLWLGGGIEAI